MKSKPIIIIDTREQHPWAFPAGGPFDGPVRAALPVGDYSLAGYEDRLFVERKNLDDFVGSVILQRERFLAELQRGLDSSAYGCIIIEGTAEDVYRHYYQSQAHPASVMGATFAITRDYGYPVIFGGPRHVCIEWAARFLLQGFEALRPRGRGGKQQSKQEVEE